ncbi:hypothetical protein HETIRDRAFT_453779 [Heterobasidion irregulare TC 32-1]|uniref:Uncharacterized protein n=1 Tax=Heterobasidion irregulare (strain TC 32-1) TaxID=747525 RepID=W4K2R6_HETIT|nr:uncharacterized protein HETIRDRAFT_453779 [Heterobasidion irregulare TC 32-1]ETW79346.1 hypothetical protein HETIRDRAFT_453779 [Heterobasidion irregulare TC 32-1]
MGIEEKDMHPFCHLFHDRFTKPALLHEPPPNPLLHDFHLLLDLRLSEPIAEVPRWNRKVHAEAPPVALAHTRTSTHGGTGSGLKTMVILDAPEHGRGPVWEWDRRADPPRSRTGPSLPDVPGRPLRPPCALPARRRLRRRDTRSCAIVDPLATLEWIAPPRPLTALRALIALHPQPASPFLSPVLAGIHRPVYYHIATPEQYGQHDLSPVLLQLPALQLEVPPLASAKRGPISGHQVHPPFSRATLHPAQACRSSLPRLPFSSHALASDSSGSHTPTA